MVPRITSASNLAALYTRTVIFVALWSVVQSFRLYPYSLCKSTTGSLSSCSLRRKRSRPETTATRLRPDVLPLYYIKGWEKTRVGPPFESKLEPSAVLRNHAHYPNGTRKSLPSSLFTCTNMKTGSLNSKCLVA